VEECTAIAHAWAAVLRFKFDIDVDITISAPSEGG
jgi:hypothetical protein